MKTTILIIAFALFTFLGFAQETPEWKDSMYVITTVNGDVKIGQILADDGREILLNTREIGKVYIRKENIKSIVVFQDNEFRDVVGEYRGLGHFSTRYYFTTNALPIKKGENYTVLHLFGPEVHFAVNDRLSLGIITTWIASPFIGAVKYNIPTQNKKVNFGLGTLVGTSGYLNTFRGFGGLHWGMVTFGDRFNNITLSAGYSYIKTGLSDNTQKIYYEAGNYPAKNNGSFYSFVYPIPIRETIKENIIKAPVLGFGAITKVSKKSSFIFDGMIFIGANSNPYYGQEIVHHYDPISNQPSYLEIKPNTITYNTSTLAVLMPGMRFQKRESSAFQVSLAGIIIKDDFEVRSFPIPLVNWFIKF